MKRFLVLLAALIALVPVAVQAAIPRPAPLSPKNKATLSAGKTPTFKVRSTGEGTMWIHVSKSAKRNAEGVIGKDAVIQAIEKRKGSTWTIKPTYYSYPAFWANQKRKWYWQTYRISCGEEPKSSDCKIESPVRAFTLR
jgi:hypothetical protein